MRRRFRASTWPTCCRRRASRRPSATSPTSPSPVPPRFPAASQLRRGLTSPAAARARPRRRCRCGFCNFGSSGVHISCSSPLYTYYKMCACVTDEALLRAYACMDARICVRKHARTRARPPARPPARPHARTQARTHARGAHSHTHTLADGDWKTTGALATARQLILSGANASARDRHGFSAEQASRPPAHASDAHTAFSRAPYFARPPPPPCARGHDNSAERGSGARARACARNRRRVTTLATARRASARQRSAAQSRARQRSARRNAMQRAARDPLPGAAEATLRSARGTPPGAANTPGLRTHRGLEQTRWSLESPRDGASRILGAPKSRQRLETRPQTESSDTPVSRIPERGPEASAERSRGTAPASAPESAGPPPLRQLTRDRPRFGARKRGTAPASATHAGPPPLRRPRASERDSRDAGAFVPRMRPPKARFRSPRSGLGGRPERRRPIASTPSCVSTLPHTSVLHPPAPYISPEPRPNPASFPPPRPPCSQLAQVYLRTETADFLRR